MTEMEEIKLAAYNSYKRHMRVFGKGKDILSFAEWEKKACEVTPFVGVWIETLIEISL